MFYSVATTAYTLNQAIKVTTSLALVTETSPENLLIINNKKVINKRAKNVAVNFRRRKVKLKPKMVQPSRKNPNIFFRSSLPKSLKAYTIPNQGI